MAPGLAMRALALLAAALAGGVGAAGGGGSAGDTVSLLQHATDVQALARGADNVRLTVKDERGKELHLEVRRTTRLGKLIDVVCKRLNLEKEYAMFDHAGRHLSQYDTVEEFGLDDQDVIEVTGGRVARTAPVRREVPRLHGGTMPDSIEVHAQASAAKNATAEQAEQAAQQSTTAAPVVAVAKPPPPLPIFQVGDFVYVNISNGTDADSASVANTWAPCSIVSRGSKNNTYNIHFIYSPLGFRDARDVAVQLLRRVDGRRYAEAIQYYREDAEAIGQVTGFVRVRQEEELAKKAAAAAAAQAAANASAAADDKANATAGAAKEEEEEEEPQAVGTWEVGDFMRVRLETDINSTSGNISWVPCRLLGKGVRNGSYQVHFLFGPPGHADLTNISTDYLHKVGSREFAELSKKMKRVGQQAQEAVIQLEEEAANRTKAEEERLAREIAAREAAERTAREAAEAAKRKAEADRKAAAEKAAREAAERKAKRERDLAKRAAEEQEAKRLAQFVYKDGAAVELKVEKTFKGTNWIPGNVVRKGAEPNSFDVHFDWGPAQHQDIANVTTAFLHPVDADKFADLMSKFKTDADAAQAAMKQAEKEAGRRKRALIAERKALANAAAAGTSSQPPAAAASLRSEARAPAKAAAPAVAALAVGDAVEIKLEKSVEGLNWIPCTVAEAGSRRNAFNIRFGFAVPNHSQDFKNVPKELLRKADGASAAKTLEQLSAKAELAEAAITEVEREATRRARQEEAARRRRQEAKAAKR